jgi:dTDP-4-dehydrorhamnose 3,5-epimerase and related enzymes
MQIAASKLEGVLQITPPTIFEDFRGHYVETYNKTLYNEHGITADFVQDDISVSTKDVLRGIHGDAVTWKLISCLLGKFYMVVINWDEQSPQYRQWDSFVLSEHNRKQVLVPPKHGIGHLVLSEQAIFHYKQSTYYDRQGQFTLVWDAPELGIWWPIQNPILSRRDLGLE